MKRLLLLVMLLLLVPVASALPKLHYRNDTRIRFFDYRINASECLDMMSYIPDKYFAKLTAITFYGISNRNFLALYIWGPKFFYVYRGRCDASTIIHELAHHQQYINGFPLRDAVHHNGTFVAEEERITEWYECNRFGYACWRLNESRYVNVTR